MHAIQHLEQGRLAGSVPAEERVNFAPGNLEVHVDDRNENGEMLLITRGIPNLSVDLPPSDTKSYNKTLPLTGQTDPGNKIWVNDRPVEVAADGRFEGSGSGTKRYGTNKVSKKDRGFISFYGLAAEEEGVTSGELVASGSGDSGGPMFVDGQLVGVTSGGGLVRTADGGVVSVSHYVDLNSTESLNFLSQHIAD